MSIDIQGFLFEDSPAARWTLENVDPLYTTCGKLLRKFYREYKWDKKPLGWARNPVDKDGRPFFSFLSDVIVAPYRRNFYITIERQYREIFGPHAVRLMYRSDQVKGEITWVAICQLSAMWHSDERMQAALQISLDAKELYHSEKTSEIIVLQ